MTRHPYSNVAIVAGYNTVQARQLPGATSLGLTIDAAMGAIEAAGMAVRDVDAVYGLHALDLMYSLGIGPARGSDVRGGMLGVFDAANAIAAGAHSTVLLAGGLAGMYPDRVATASWTRPSHEFVISAGMFTAVEFALVARRHMHMYGTTPEQMATVAATIRNNGHVNPDAVYFDRGPFTPADILASRMVADPFHLLDCSMAAEGGAAILMTTADRAAGLRLKPVYVLGGSPEYLGPSYVHPPAWDLGSTTSEEMTLGTIGRRAARHAFATAGLRPADVDVCELYDPFSFEIIRQYEAFEFCGPGEGGDFVMDGNIAPDGRFPTTTDGGTMSFGHSGWAQVLQRVVRGVHQIQGICASRQIQGAEVAMCTGGGAGALWNDVILLGAGRP